MLRHLASVGMRAALHPGFPWRGAAAARGLACRGRAPPPAVRAISTPLRQAEVAAPAPLGWAARPALTGPSIWQLYLASLQHRPVATKALTSFVMTCLSDTLAQVLGGAAGYSAWRCVRLGLYSASVGALSGHFWHRWLEGTCCPDQPTSWRAVGTKLALDQLVFTPVMTCAYLAFLKAPTPHLILPFIGERLVSTLLAGYAVWPAVNIITFKCVPQDLRTLTGSIVGLGWGTYMSISCVNASVCAETNGTALSEA